MKGIPLGPRALIFYCGMLMSISAFSVDITLPSFPAMTQSLGARYELVQWTITIYMASAGVAQLLWGSASDRFGRKPALGCGLAIYFAGCVAAALAPTIAVLLIARAAQGFGAAAAIVSSRAIIRDLFSGEELARNLALATAIFAIGPILAPLLGAGIAIPLGWRGIFAVLGVFSAGLLFFLARLPETIRAKSPDAMRWSVIDRRSRRLFAHPQSRHFLAFSAIINSTMLLILTALPRIYDTSFNVTGTLFAVFFALHGVGIVIGQIANRRLIRIVGVVRSMLIANTVLILAAALMLLLTRIGLMNAYSMTALVVLFATSYLIVFSNAAAMVLDPHGDIAGFAAAFFGFMSQIGSAIIVSVLVLAVGDSIYAFATVLLALCAVCFCGVWMWLEKA